MILFNRQVLAHKTNQPFKVGLSSRETGMCQHQKAATLRGFCFLDSEAMRYVGGCFLKNPATRASQSRDGGLSLEPGG